MFVIIGSLKIDGRPEEIAAAGMISDRPGGPEGRGPMQESATGVLVVECDDDRGWLHGLLGRRGRLATDGHGDYPLLILGARPSGVGMASIEFTSSGPSSPGHPVDA
jgi:hypothetical protein